MELDLSREEASTMDVGLDPINRFQIDDLDSLENRDDGAGMAARKRRGTSKVRIIKGRLRIRVGKGRGQIVAFSPSALVRHLPINKIRQAAKKLFRRSQTAVGGRRLRKRKTGRRKRRAGRRRRRTRRSRK